MFPKCKRSNMWKMYVEISFFGSLSFSFSLDKLMMEGTKDSNISLFTSIDWNGKWIQVSKHFSLDRIYSSGDFSSFLFLSIFDKLVTNERKISIIKNKE